ncbi:MAG TPA: helix-turn-helix domain-containing protein [Thermomicrobiales bacterium]|nr:helix-turn-helix domain-containing protein [Thermomicrobiales bacterium]
MESTSGEITLHDLLAWEPRLSVVAPPPGTAARDEALDRDVEWVMTARANAPMLPAMRGGELVILPRRIAQETGIPFARLVSEMLLHPIAGILTDEPVPELPDLGIAVLSMPAIAPETEGELNRLLASRRRELLAIASDVDRLLGDAQSRGARSAEAIEALSRMLGIPVSILTRKGETLLSTASMPIGDRVGPAWLETPLRPDHSLWLGPIPPEARARARMSLGRIREAMQRLIDREASSVPRGSARTSALQALLLPDPIVKTEAFADAAYHAGIVPGRTLHVALVSPDQGSHQIRRLLAPLGEIHDAGAVDGLTALVCVAPATGVHAVIPPEMHADGWIAISGAVTAARDLPEATRQARYVARLLQQGALPGPVGRFDSDPDLGLYRVLYPQWGASDLAAYCTALLGDLRREDRHGTLIETLRVFLEEGGSLRPAAERLGIHRNTLTYRMRQIRDVLDADLDSPRIRLGLQVALVADALPEAPA